MSSSHPWPERTGKLLKAALMEAFQARFRFQGGRFSAGGGGRFSATSGGGAFSARSGGGRKPKPFGEAAWRAVAREVKVLHEAYTVGTGGFSHEENPLHRRQAGYQFYYLPRNFFRVRQVLDSLPWVSGENLGALATRENAGNAQARLRVLDLGCGTGAFSLALLSRLAEQDGGGGKLLPRLELVLVDQGRGLLELAAANIRAFAALALPELALSLEAHPEGVENFLAAGRGKGGFAVLGGAMMLNEMNLLAPRRGSKRAARFAQPFKRLVNRGGLLMFVEPGTRKGYMNLMALREQLAGMPILYPCPHGEACPMWTPRVRRWCHATRALPRPFLFDEELRREGGLGFQMREVNLAALAVQAAPSGGVLPPFRETAGSRIVSARLPRRKGAVPDGGKSNAEEAVVLQCRADGALTELAATGLGPHPRGLWLPAERSGASGRSTGRQWARKR